MTRQETRQVRGGGIPIGGGAPISVQTMCTASPHDPDALIRQAKAAREAGCDILRATLPDTEAVEPLRRLCRAQILPIVADIHFDHRLAIAAVQAGVDAVRLNPGNIRDPDALPQVVAALKPRRIPVRIGVNGGSLQKDLLDQYGSATPEALVQSALQHAQHLERLDYREIVLSAKASDVQRTIQTYRLLAQKSPYPLHLGLTEAGTLLAGTIRSSVALGTLLLEGIGDTIRISLTDDIAQEVAVGRQLLQACGLLQAGPTITSCPTCGRTQVDLIPLAKQVETTLAHYYRQHPRAKSLHIAVMGCIVNGPGEAADADIALCGGKQRFALYEKGQLVQTIPEHQALTSLLTLVDKLAQ